MNIKNRIKQIMENNNFRNIEDSPILNFLNLLDKNKSYSLLEVGSGLCRFVDKIKVLYPNIKITCLELNSDLAEIARDKGFKIYNENILQNTLKSENYDIVHCSHVIEHFGYPEITFVLDELLRLTKKNQYLIIRSPLMWKNFYADLDHIRPYPPLSITSYFENLQQQKKGQNTLTIERIWYRTMPIRIGHGIIGNANNKLFKYIKKFINIIFECLWIIFKFPASKANGYVMILKKIT